VSGELSTSGRVEEDYLAEMEWVPFRSLENYDLIANMRPVVKAFLKKIGVGVDSQ